MTDDKITRLSKQTGARRLRTWVSVIVAVLIAGVTLTLVNNNYSFSRQSRRESQLDVAIDRATNWIAADPRASESNPSLIYMIADMERMSGNAKLRSLLNDYSKYLSISSNPLNSVWVRLVNRDASVPMLTVGDLRYEGFEQRWDAYALAPKKVELMDADRADMFSPTKYYWGRRQHQLLALVMYRDFNGGNEELNNTLNYLSEKVSRDAHFDFRVSDSYIQRTAFVLAAGRPDLIRRRWVERILDNQNPDGSWNYCWYGWCRGIFEFGMRGYPAHTTVQAAWALYMLKYRYPAWIKEHYR